MKRLVFATNNPNKLREVKELIGNRFEILSLDDIGCHEDIPETADTLEGNALIKARFVKEHYGYDCFADDTGLEICALDNEPGVYSARYAGENHDSEANMQKVLSKMEGKSDRKARFRTAIALIYKNEEHIVEGAVYGQITIQKFGQGGFGYDPIFMPDGYAETFAEMDSSLKNTISHRGLAIQNFINLLNKL